MPLIVDTPVTVQTKSVVADSAPTSTVKTTSVPDYSPMQLSGVLDQYEKIRVTPKLGTEFRNVNLKEWITGPDSDAKLRDLAIFSKSLTPTTALGSATLTH